MTLFQSYLFDSLEHELSMAHVFLDAIGWYNTIKKRVANKDAID